MQDIFFVECADLHLSIIQRQNIVQHVMFHKKGEKSLRSGLCKDLTNLSSSLVRFML